MATLYLLCSNHTDRLPAILTEVFNEFPQSIQPNSRSVQMTLIRAFAIRFFAYPRFYFSIMRNISILSAATLEAVAQAHWVARAVSLTRPPFWLRGIQIKASHGLSLRKSTGIYTFPILRVLDIRGIRRNSTPAYNESWNGPWPPLEVLPYSTFISVFPYHPTMYSNCIASLRNLRFNNSSGVPFCKLCVSLRVCPMSNQLRRLLWKVNWKGYERRRQWDWEKP
jgi:hypothetical protein